MLREALVQPATRQIVQQQLVARKLLRIIDGRRLCAHDLHAIRVGRVDDDQQQIGVRHPIEIVRTRAIGAAQLRQIVPVNEQVLLQHRQIDLLVARMIDGAVHVLGLPAEVRLLVLVDALAGTAFGRMRGGRVAVVVGVLVVVWAQARYSLSITPIFIMAKERVTTYMAFLAPTCPCDACTSAARRRSISQPAQSSGTAAD